MRKSTATISLVLLGTAMALSGCHSQVKDDDEEKQPGGHGSTGTHFVPIYRGTGTGGGRATATPSARGGFGGIGSRGFGA